MNTSDAIRTAIDELTSILDQAGLRDGETLTNEQIIKAKETLYWDSVVKSKQASDKNLYLVWSLISTDKRSSADDKTKTREAYAVFDLFTRRSKTSKTVTEIISTLNSEAHNFGWNFEFKGPSVYERDTAIYQLTFELTKLL